MKKHLIFILFITSLSFSQTLKGIIKDGITNEPLPTANIVFVKNYGGTNSNLSGSYAIDVKNKQTDSLKISYLGYESKYLDLRNFTESKIYNIDILLKQKTEIIEEVTIKQKVELYDKKYSYNAKKKGDVRLFTFIGNESAYYVKNLKKEKGKLKDVSFYFRKNKKANKRSIFRVNFYIYDTINQCPGESLLKKEIQITPKNRTYKFKLQLEDYKILFPKSGVVVGIEPIDPDNNIIKGDKIGPGLRFSYGNKENLSWENYRGKKWYKSTYINKFKNQAANLLIDLTVLMK